MSDTFTPSLKLRQPATGAYNNTWGSVINSDTFGLVDTAIAGRSVLSIGSAVSFSMPAMSQGADSPSRYFTIAFSGTPSSAVAVTLPASVSSKFYLVDNFNTGQKLTFGYAGSSNTVDVAAGEKRLIWCDGTNCWDVDTAASATLGGLTATNFARVSRSAAEITANTVVQNIFADVTNVYPFTTLTLPVGSTITLDPTMGNVQQITITGNYSVGVPANTQDGSTIDLVVIQDGTGGRTLTWNSIFLFEGAAAPVLSTVGGGIDEFVMRFNASLGKWIVNVHGNITTPSGVSVPLTITSNVLDWKLLPLLGTLSGPITVTVTVNLGVCVFASAASEPAMDLSGLPSGSTVNLINNGYILGHGGDGADGAECMFPGSGVTTRAGGVAGVGGNAILGPGLSRSFNVTNVNGHIWGGGGGGGSGGATTSLSSSGCANAGGGGGGAGGGRGGKGGRLEPGGNTPQTAGSGSPGTNGPGGVGGSAGTGTITGSAIIGVSGVGGTYGVAGTTGVAPGTIDPASGTFTAGGAAGKAIELQGAAVPTVGGSVLGLIS
jgi:hypothetical protein